MTKTKQTIVINGRHYDAATGLALARADEHTPKATPRVIKDVAAPAASPAKVVKVAITHVAATANAARPTRRAAPHIKPAVQKSVTLRRNILKKPAATRRPVAQKIHKKVERSHRISRFAPLSSHIQPHKVTKEIDHVLAQQAAQLQAEHAAKQAQANNRPAISSRAIKEHLLKQQLDKAPLELHHEVYQAGRMSPRARFMSVAATSLALVLLGGYLTYINIPNLSIRVAAANAGINATLPRYQPDGYRIHGPIAYTDGQVSVNYQQGDSGQDYRIIQKASDWDPEATLDNYVKPESRGDYQIHSSQGLTVYTYNNKAVWVNGGILHIIDGNAALSGTQVEQIAVSM